MLVPHPARTPGPQEAIEKVRRLIKRKTSEKQRLLADIAECEAALAPLAKHQRAMDALDREVHALFREALGNSKLSKRARTQIQGVYEDLQNNQVISPDPERTAAEAVCSCPMCSARPADDSPFQEMFGADEPSPFGTRPPAPAPAKPQRDAGLRALYHKLALRFHPDRAQDEARRAEHEAVMREVNDAYHGGDAERMLALSRELGIEVGELQTSHGLLGELVAQYEAIKAEVRALHDSRLGALVADKRRGERHGYRSRLERMDEDVEAALAQLTGLRDFAREFAQGRMPLKTFLAGPQGMNPFDDDEEAEDMFLEFVGMVEELERSLSAAERKSKAARSGRAQRGTSRR